MTVVGRGILLIMSMTLAEPAELTETFTQQCEQCGGDADYLAKGCMDKEAVYMCAACLQRGVARIRAFIKMYQHFNKKICICGDCYRPILTLETHIELLEI